MYYTTPRIVLAALKGGSGKTVLSLGLISAWQKMGINVAPFKKGPDFIDAGWLGIAATGQCYNLDPFLMSDQDILASLVTNSNSADVCLVEGNRGVYDGINVDGKYSTAQLAKLIKAPVLLILDVTMVTRTAAALLKGCQVFDPDVDIACVILNRVAGSRQERLIRQTIEKYCGIPVVGAVPKLKENLFPERHMGLVPSQEKELSMKSVASIREIAEKNIEIDRILQIARKADPLGMEGTDRPVCAKKQKSRSNPVIGFVRDKAFWFYYPENLEQLQAMGVRLVEVSALSDKELPSVDALYIGGGFPETHAYALAENVSFRMSLKERIETGLPVYAECGGLMYLGKDLQVNGQEYPMTGSLPIRFEFKKRPQGHGYSILEVSRANPYFPLGMLVYGHEFHYSKPVITEKNISFAFRIRRGHGIDGSMDGITVKNVLATYTHIHARGNRHWAESLVRAADRYMRQAGN